MRSKEVNPLAAEASRQAAHSMAEPRASSKNLARWRPCRLPLPSAVFRSADRLARSSCSLSSRVGASDRPIGQPKIEYPSSETPIRVGKHRVFRVHSETAKPELIQMRSQASC